jgi:hypothetical protein
MIILLMIIGSILLVTILLVAIDGYSINDYW